MQSMFHLGSKHQFYFFNMYSRECLSYVNEFFWVKNRCFKQFHSLQGNNAFLDCLKESLKEGKEVTEIYGMFSKGIMRTFKITFSEIAYLIAFKFSVLLH